MQRKHIQRFEIWAEGANGNVHLEVKSISAGVSKTVQTTESEGVLVTFDGADGTTIKFDFEPDPVMVPYFFIIFCKAKLSASKHFFCSFQGGASYGSWAVDSVNSIGIMNGTVAIVPFLGAPGFIKSVGDGHFNDVSDFIFPRGFA